MRLSNGREELVLNEDHVKRLLGEGAVEIVDPRVPQESETPKGPEQPQAPIVPSGETGTEQAPSQEGVADGSTNVNDGSDSTSAPDDQRPGADTTVQRSRRTK
jgi:hypothetical protein